MRCARHPTLSWRPGTAVAERGGRALPERLDALDEAVRLADARIDDELVNRARAVLDKARGRLARGPETVVVALGGGTGSGKSSLFNALAGEDLSRVGPVRPVTSEVASLAVGDAEGAAAVLDWLTVRRRHVASPTSMLPEGLVLLDLPDHDSVEMEHRRTVDRFVERVDVLVWVVDPLKYAQRALHDGYLRMLAAHARVVVVVLNHIDSLARDARAAVLSDLRRLLDEEGLQRARLVSTSARTGEGVAGLRTTIADFVAKRRAVAQRVAGDLANVSAAMAAQVGAPVSATLDVGRLSRALANASGIDALAETGRGTYVDDANDASRPLLTGAVLKRVRSARRPLRRLRRPAGAGHQAEISPIGVRHAVVELADEAARGLPHPWPQRLHSAAQSAGADLPGAVAKAVDRVDVHDVRRRAWWRMFAVIGTVFEAALLLGVVWLTMLAVVAWLQLPPPPTFEFREVPVPTLLAVGGGIATVLWNLLRRRLVSIGAGRHRTKVLTHLRAAVSEAAEERAVVPLRAELQAQGNLAAALRQAAGSPR